MKDKYFCTYFNCNYCDKGLALYGSLIDQVRTFTLFILCMDEETYDILKKMELQSVELIALRDLEERNPDFFSIKDTRSTIEYFFTSTPILIRDILQTHREIDIITYLDADMYLFSPIDSVYEEMGDQSILIVEHRFPPELDDRLIYGRFNIGFLSFRNDKYAEKCLNDWGNDCISWCYDRVEEDKFADQKYLDKWPSRYDRLVISENIGLNAGPWNIFQYTLTHSNKKGFFLDGSPLIAYHFHGIKEEFRSPPFYCFDLLSREYFFGDKPVSRVYQGLYYHYLRKIIRWREIINEHNNHPIDLFGNIRICHRNYCEEKQPLQEQLLKLYDKIIVEKCLDDIILFVKFGPFFHRLSPMRYVHDKMYRLIVTLVYKLLQ